MNQKYNIGLSSPPDREKLVSDILYSNEQIIEINQEKEKPEIIIYPKKNNEPWVLDYEDFMNALKEAYTKLIDR